MSQYFLILCKDNGFQGDEYDSEPPCSTAGEWITENRLGGDFGNNETLGAIPITDLEAKEMIADSQYVKIKDSKYE